VRCPGLPRRLAGVIASALVMTLLAGTRGEGAEPYAITAVLPITGGAAFLGKQEAEALQLFEATTNAGGGINGRPVAIDIQDDQTNPQVAVQLLSVALANHPAMVIDGGPASTCRATAALVTAGPIEYCFTPSIHPPPGSYQFSALYSSDDILGVSLRYLRERGLKKIAVLNGTDASGQDADKILATLIAAPDNVKAGLTFVAYEHYNLTDLGVDAQLARIKAAGAQALITFTTGTAVATVLRGVQNDGLDIPIVTSPGNMSYAQMESYAAFMPRELLFAGPPLLVPDQLTDPGVKRAVATFTTVFRAHGGQRPDLLAAVAWDPMELVATTLAKRGAAGGSTQLRDDLAEVQDWPGVLGRYDFRTTPQRGINSSWVIMERWDRDRDGWVAVSKAGGSLTR
jgi:branched-chain amino acid transport system substrate-binding protein